MTRYIMYKKLYKWKLRGFLKLFLTLARMPMFNLSEDGISHLVLSKPLGNKGGDHFVE